MSCRYSIESNGDIALSAATAKSVLAYVNGSGKLARIVELCASFDGVTSTAEPVTVELCKSTQATAGTSTAHTMAQVGGPTRTVTGTARRNYTAEPTVLTVILRWLVHPQGLPLVIQFPLGREPEQVTSANALTLRCTAPAAVNFQDYLVVEEG